MNEGTNLSLGGRLKELRLEKNLTLEQVRRKTKIPLNILEAIEEDRLININSVYVKGFLKIYCELLGTDPQEYIKQYKGSTISQEEYIKKEKRLFSGTKPKINLSLLYRSGSRLKVAGLVFLFFILGFIIFRLTHVKRLTAPPLGEKKTAQTEGAKSITPSSYIKVGIRAKEDCWIKATVDGKVVFQSILRKGRFETWQAKDKIEFSLGNAGGIDLEVNDKVFSPLGRRGQIIRRVLINKEGLQVIK